jgi:hypothetical protein
VTSLDGRCVDPSSRSWSCGTCSSSGSTDIRFARTSSALSLRSGLRLTRRPRFASGTTHISDVAGRPRRPNGHGVSRLYAAVGELRMGREMARARPVTVQVIAYAPTVFRHCQHCEVVFAGLGFSERMHHAEAADALPVELLQEFQQVSDWIHSLLERYADGLKVSVVDAASIEGVWKSLRHGVRRYPAVVVDGESKFVGTDFAPANRLIDRRLVARRERRGAA